VTAATVLDRRRERIPAPDGNTLLNALPHPVLAIDGDNRLRMANLAAEQFLAASWATLAGRTLADILPAGSPVFGLIDQVRQFGGSVSEYGLSIETPRIKSHIVTVEIAAMPEYPGWVAISLHERSIALKIDRQLVHRGAARSVSAMAAMLAHEVKNPLSGIRGAAQLLEDGASPGDRALTRLICDETDRICALVDRMEAFSDSRPVPRRAVNIHRVLEHVKRLAEAGFARGVRFVERYDPSLPPALGSRDQLVQIFLNLVKNAAEAVPAGDGEIVLQTAYQHGVRLAVPGAAAPLKLPLMVTIQDNGPGIPEDIRPHLFDPFVTTKVNGTGLGLALVAKIVGNHGGVIEFDSQNGRTAFRVLLPVAPADLEADDA
jgi:two-component system nitrogen regulation sensor histidine kinase GlnL